MSNKFTNKINFIKKRYNQIFTIKSIKKFSNKKFIRNVITVASGTAAAQAITMLFSPIITRLYGPENYGVMGTFIAIIAIVTPIAALTYPTAIVLPKSDNHAKGIVRLSLYITMAITIITAIVLFLFNQQIIELFNIETISPYLFLIPVAILLGGFLQVVEQWLIRTKQFRITAQVSVIQALIIHGGQAGLGYIHPVASVLVLFSAIKDGVKGSLMLLFSQKGEQRLSFIPKDKTSVKKLAIYHKNFPLYRAPQVFLNATSQSLPILMLTTFFGPVSAGLYSIGRTVLNIPSTLIGKSVGDVFYPRISEAANKGENLTKLIKKATITLAVVGILPYSLVVLLGPWLFTFVFGQDWTIAGEYARWLSLWVFFMFINQPSIRALLVLNAQSFHLKFTVLTLITRVVALAIGYYFFSSDLLAIALFGISGAILNLLLIFITLKFSEKFDRQRRK
ncbi:lipopolysaccharide biosynthesis protein [Thalassobacillus sp. B23F22_16]|uniref:lipopolysaccharide biosynthesis protein n=1 Tax=Thalassobacillus sp. B23F22_16 TaxID=3459513 RepID=UPI00373FB460